MESTESSVGFHQYWLILKRRWLPTSAIFGLVVVLALVYTSRQKPVYEAEAKLLLKKTNPTSSITGLGKEIGEFAPVGEQSNPLNTEIEVIRSESIVQKTISKLNLLDEKNSPLKVKDFLKNLSVANIKGTDMLSVAYKEKNPQKPALIVNTLIQIYIDNNQTLNRAEAVYAREFLEKQLPNAEASVRQAEASMRRFKEQNKVVSLQEEAKSAVEVIGILEGKIAEAKSQFADANAESEAFQNQLQMNAQEGLTATSLSQSPSVQEALKEYQQVERQLAIERIRFHETHPLIVDLKTKEASLKALLQAQIQKSVGSQKQSENVNLQMGEVKPRLIEEFVKIEAKRRGLANQVYTLSKQQAVYKERVSVIPRLEQQQRELESKLQAAQSTYALLLQKLQEIRIAENQNMGNARIIQAALVPQEPLASRKSSSIVTGVLLGGMFSIATALILEAADKSIRTVEEVRDLFGFSLLGAIPFDKKYKKISKLARKQSLQKHLDLQQSVLDIVVSEAPDSPVSTAYRMLQTNLYFLNSDRDLKIIVVTSSLPKEGKSTVCANLAVAMAQMGRRVLLVDADALNPRSHQVSELSDRGLGNVLVGQEQIITTAQVMVNLEVLTCESLATNSTAVMDSPGIASLINKFSAKYDLTIVDAPSLKVSTDALFLGKMADGLLLVSRLGVLDLTSANVARDFLEKSRQNVLGLVVGFPKSS
ncbi:GumC family protein [Aerosakkonema funiforme]|uniref:Polysaccharide biosynthesis tyrosine autokinase n=2 Tax=Oscillatoriophycideae TaxID=1301283 RepID=A0A926ZK25_9CYAN|nr:polysaccharide biosynthesis tyrosine autokinase [Aerosakkonema funiforme]MBD2184942.1 polysaccharide biosynthesis tyrosine autokinase [Aerosakkonema funiforme FACHB-1375]